MKKNKKITIAHSFGQTFRIAEDRSKYKSMHDLFSFEHDANYYGEYYSYKLLEKLLPEFKKIKIKNYFIYYL